MTHATQSLCVYAALCTRNIARQRIRCLNQLPHNLPHQHVGGHKVSTLHIHHEASGFRGIKSTFTTANKHTDGTTQRLLRQSTYKLAHLRNNTWNHGWRQGRAGGGARASSSWQRPGQSSTAYWLLLPVSLSAIHLDDGNSIETLVDKAQDLYEHAKDLTLNEKSSLLDEGDQLPFLDRVFTQIHRWIVEPLGTARRFLYLAFLFLPVIFTAPLLALELIDERSPQPATPSSSKRRRRQRTQERITTRWWYSFLVKQMERAGPTFIKVRNGSSY